MPLNCSKAFHFCCNERRSRFHRPPIHAQGNPLALSMTNLLSVVAKAELSESPLQQFPSSLYCDSTLCLLLKLTFSYELFSSVWTWDQSYKIWKWRKMYSSEHCRTGGQKVSKYELKSEEGQWLPFLYWHKKATAESAW